MNIIRQLFPKASNKSIRLFAVSPVLIVLLLILIPARLAPYFETNLMSNQYQLLYSNLGKICHQFPTHSFYIFGSNMGICSRCFSIYFALLLSSIFLIFYHIKISWQYRCLISIVLAVPLLVTDLLSFMA